MDNYNKKNIIQTFIVLIFITTITLISASYAKFIHEQNIKETISVPEYNHCLSNNINNLGECIIANEYNVTNTSLAKNTIKLKNVDLNTVPTSDEGMYSIADDYGDSYYFRGSVSDNYVSFANHIWRVVRINGDGSVRLIYAGTTTNSTGDETLIGQSEYNSLTKVDMATVGYAYGLSQSSKSQSNAKYANIDPEKSYLYASKYSCNSNGCTLSGSTRQGTWQDSYFAVSFFDLSNLFNRPKYTCWTSSIDEPCNVVMEITSSTSISEATQAPEIASGKYNGYLSSSYAATRTNTNSSTIKTHIENWYQTNIQNVNDANGVSYNNYVSDTKFCNDRTLSSGDGYTLSANSVYAPSSRIATPNPTLSCSSTEDTFTTNTSNGNGKLTHPIGLITTDELILSGYKNGTVGGSYLETGANFWTMSPSKFDVSKLLSYVYSTNSGDFTEQDVKTTSGVRPVINLSSSVKISRGNGTINNPYQLTLN